VDTTVDATPGTAPDTPSTPPERTGGRLSRLSRRLSEGLPVRLVAGLAFLVLIAILFTVATREPEKARGYAELTLFPGACIIDTAHESNTVGCAPLGPRAYRVAFARSIVGSTPIASRGSCCPGGIGATIEGDRTVVIAFARKVKKPIRASVLLP
jgi:hypothetical protein